MLRARLSVGMPRPLPLPLFTKMLRVGLVGLEPKLFVWSRSVRVDHRVDHHLLYFMGAARDHHLDQLKVNVASLFWPLPWRAGTTDDLGAVIGAVVGAVVGAGTPHREGPRDRV